MSFSPDMKYWGEHRCVMKVAPFDQSAWQCTKNRRRFSALPHRGRMADVLPRRDKHLQRFPLLYGRGNPRQGRPHQGPIPYKALPACPAAPYELAGDVPDVVFPCAALQDGERVAVFYGAADTTVCMAFGYINEIVDFVKNNSL